ncbi:MAG: GAF domain-containing protein [Deltaproteobacteria bacterium]|nr:GAF domain-containing protein [Deltaproteobacteria bacterium]
MTEEVERLKKEIEDLRSQISSMHKDASREEELKTLARLSAILNSTLDPREVQKRAMESATELMKAEVGSLLLVDEKRNELYFEVALGEKGAKVKEIRLKVGEGIAGWVAQNGEPLVIDDVTKDPRFSGKADEKSKFATKNMICVPVMIKEKITGVLQAINKSEGMFSPKDLELFQMLANQVAIAIDNARLMEGLRQTFYETAEALAEAIEKRDPYTGGHTKRVLTYSMASAEYMGVSPQEMDWLKLSAILHDIGKIGVEDRVLRKQGSLNDEEFALMKAHPRMGAEIMEYVEKLKDIIPGMKHHHERFDGKGYPDGLKDGEIPLIARIISVSDTFDAMTSDRPYRKGLSDETAINELQKHAGVQFDPVVVRAFIEAYKDGKIISCRFKNCEEKTEGSKTL